MLKAAQAVFPVLFLIGLGWICARRKWISQKQADGAWDLILKVFFPLLIFNLMASARIESDSIWIVVYLFCATILVYLAAGVICRRVIPGFKAAPFLVCTEEGGNVALPLYLTLVPGSTTTVIFDIAVLLFNFVLVPVVLEHQNAEKEKWSTVLLSLFKNPFFMASLLGVAADLTGFYAWFISTAAGGFYTPAVSMLTAPIVPVILFCLGYRLNVHLTDRKDLVELILIRAGAQALTASGFFLFFPALCAQREFLAALLIYFSSPVSFGLLPMLNPVMKTDQERAFVFEFSSLYMVLTITVFILTSLWYQ